MTVDFDARVVVQIIIYIVFRVEFIIVMTSL